MSNRPPDSQEHARFSRQLDSAFEDASRLAGSSLAPADFYEKFLNRVLEAIDAPAGAVWLRTPQGFLQVATQQNLEKVGLDEKRGGRQCHNEVLRQVFQASPPRPVLIEPQGRLGNGPVEPGGVPAANLTDFYALFAPIVGPEKQSLGLLEVFQESSHDPRLYQTFLQYTLQMAGYASQYHSFNSSRQVLESERTLPQVEAFTRLIHTSLNPTEVAYFVANEGRKLIEADRVSVGVRHSGKVTVEAVSGADVVEKASTHVRRMRALFDAVLKFNDKLVFQGTRDEALPLWVLKALDEYLAESQPKLLVVTPIRDEREKDSDKPARSALLVEVFDPTGQMELILKRLDVVGKHAASALYNAAEMRRHTFPHSITDALRRLWPARHKGEQPTRAETILPTGEGATSSKRTPAGGGGMISPPPEKGPAVPAAKYTLEPPTFEEAHSEWMRYHRAPAELVDPGCEHAGQFVAFFDGKPWGYDHDPTELRTRTAKSLNVHPDRLVISYLG